MGTDPSSQSISLAPLCGRRDKEAEKSLRLKRWQARRWMRENNIIEIQRRTEWVPAPVI